MASRHRAHNRGVGPFLLSITEGKFFKSKGRESTRIAALKFLGTLAQTAFILVAHGGAGCGKQFNCEAARDQGQQT